MPGPEQCKDSNMINYSQHYFKSGDRTGVNAGRTAVWPGVQSSARATQAGGRIESGMSKAERSKAGTGSE